MKRKTTLFLDEGIYKATKQLAVTRDVPVQALVNEALKRLVEEAPSTQVPYRARVAKALKSLSSLPPLGPFEWEAWEKEYLRDKGGRHDGLP